MAVAQGFRTYRVGDLGGQIRNRAGRSKIDLRGSCFCSPGSILTVFQAASKQKRRVGVRRSAFGVRRKETSGPLRSDGTYATDGTYWLVTIIPMNPIGPIRSQGPMCSLYAQTPYAETPLRFWARFSFSKSLRILLRDTRWRGQYD